jgi:hypothetical protein
MPSDTPDQVGSLGDADGDDISRRERELEQVRADIERLRRERAASIAAFNELTRPAREAAVRKASGAGAPNLASGPPVEGVGVSADVIGPAIDGPADPWGLGADDDAEAAAEGADGAGAAAVAGESMPEITELPQPEPATIAPPPVSPSRSRPTGAILAFVALAVGAAVATWWAPWSRGRTPATESAFQTTGRSVPPSVPEQGQRSPAAEPPPAPVKASRLRVELLTSRPVWMRAVADGRVIASGTVPANETLTLEADRDVTLRIGDAGAVRVRVNGRDRGLAGRDGQVVTTTIDAANEAGGRGPGGDSR